MSKYKVAGILSLIVALVAFLSTGVFLCGNTPVAVHAETEVTAPEEDAPAPDSEDPAGSEETDEEGTLRALVESFLARLKAKYGDDYETYYNAIIAEWGSVEEYLLSLVTENTPDVVASGWAGFVQWLDDYSSVWATVFAIAIVIMLILIGRRALSKIGGWANGNKKQMKTAFNSIKKLYRAHLAEQRALIALLGANERFKDEREALEQSMKEIESDETV